MRTTLGLNIPTLVIFVVLACAVGKPAFGDSLSVTGGPSGGTCPQTVSSGGASVSCGNAALGDLAAASGNLAAGTFGASTSVNPVTVNPLNGFLEGSSSGASVQVFYNFAVTGVQSGTADFNVSLNGLLTENTAGCIGIASNGCASASAEFNFLNSETVIVNGIQTQNFLQLSSGVTDVTVGTNISNGLAQLDMTLSVGATCGGGFSSCSASADFLDPVTITGASVYDSNGNLVSGASLISDSGFNPNAGGTVATPEPSSLMLLAVGLFALACGIRRA